MHKLGKLEHLLHYFGNQYIWDMILYPIATGIYIIKLENENLTHQTKLIYEN